MLKKILQYQFDTIRVDLAAFKVFRNEEPLKIEPKAFEVLVYLLENRKRTVEKQEILDKIWRDTYVTENALTRIIAQLRKALGDAKQSRYIETVPKHGYRFIAEVSIAYEEMIESLAVLPFASNDGGSNVEYLGDGLTEDLIDALSRLPRLRVTARSIAFRYKGVDTDPLAIGRELGVHSIVLGRISIRSDELTVKIDLVDAATGSQLWGARYERQLADLLVVRELISKDIFEAIKQRLAGDTQTLPARRETENARAYQIYLRGRYHWNLQTPEGMSRSISYFNQAIVEDPEYALAYAGLADAYTWLATFGFQRPSEAFPKAKAAALKAVELDDESAVGYASLAAARMNYDWDWKSTEEEISRAIDLDPRYAYGIMMHSQYLMWTGQVDAAVEEAQRALELDPLSFRMNLNLGWACYYARRFQEAAEQFQTTLELNPNFAPALYGLGESYVQQGDLAEAIATLEQAKQLAGGYPSSSLAYVYTLAGRHDAARHELAELIEHSQKEYVSPYYVAVIYAGFGDIDQTLTWLEKAYSERSGTLLTLRVNPKFDVMRSDPRFGDMIERIGPEETVPV